MLRLAPRVDVMPALFAAVATGPTLVVAPEHDTVALLATRLRRAGLSVAVVPDDWVAAAGKVGVNGQQALDALRKELQTRGGSN